MGGLEKQSVSGLRSEKVNRAKLDDIQPMLLCLLMRLKSLSSLFQQVLCFSIGEFALFFVHLLRLEIVG